MMTWSLPTHGITKTKKTMGYIHTGCKKGFDMICNLSVRRHKAGSAIQANVALKQIPGHITHRVVLPYKLTWT